MQDMDFSLLAEETLDTFAEIATTASNKLSEGQTAGPDSFAAGNTLTGGKAFQNLDGIQRDQRYVLEKLCQEPAIVRLVLEDDDQNQLTLYIARTGNLPLSSGKKFASYRSPLGRLAELPLGDEDSVVLDGQQKRYWVVEKIGYQPTKDAEGWDSKQTQYRHFDRGSWSIESLRTLLRAENIDSADELDRMLEQAEAQSGIVAGISHQVRTAMGLRDQPILDQFQGEIFRLPLNSQLMILGPPGTGKTTTLIKRLGQKLDVDSLDVDERRFVDASNAQRPHQTNWLMFTPSELLKHYLKEAFNREQVPALGTHITTWINFRNIIARNTLGILRTANGGRFTLKNDQSFVSTTVVQDASIWYEAFQQFHESRLRQQLLDGLEIVSAAAPKTGQAVLRTLQALSEKLKYSSLIEFYRDLDDAETEVKQALFDIRSIADDLLKRERNRLYNSNKEVFQQLAKHLETLQQDNETDDEEQFDSDEQEETVSPNQNRMQVGVNAYLSAIKTLARTRYLKRNLAKSSRSASVVKFLAEAIPSNEVLIEIGRYISFQNGLRRFINSHRRWVMDIPSSYQQFRKEKSRVAAFYADKTINATHLSGIELDLIVLSMLKNTRHLLSQSFVSIASDEARFSYLLNIAELFRNQVMVDEATDFSMLELACMANLTNLDRRSFFACGDFNQRITATGIRQREQLEWILPSLSVRTVQLVYRQSRKLNVFAAELLRLQGGDLSALGQVPDESTHEGVNPVLFEGANDDSGTCWIAERIKEVERSVQQLPTIAVLVNSEEEVKPTAEQLSRYLEEVNLSAVACEEGKVLGEGTDVRVFDIQHIKGLEFEAVFFAGVDRLVREKPDLFDRYLYVGATRAATYLGLVCYGVLPEKLEPIRPLFDSAWSE